MSDIPDEPRARFEHFSNEYAQALQAFSAIENQAATLLLMGHTEELRNFIAQFVEMATRTRDVAREQNEANFAEWFDELIEKAGKLQTAVPNIER